MNCPFKRSSQVLLFVLILWSVTSGCSTITSSGGASAATSVSVSDNGRYVLSSHRDGKVRLWDIEESTSQQLDQESNAYAVSLGSSGESAYWQDQAGAVFEGRSGSPEVILEGPIFYSLGTSNKEGLLVGSDEGWGIYIYDGEQSSVLREPVSGSFGGYGKALNLSVSPDSAYLVTSGFSSPRQYDVDITSQDSGFRDLVGVVLWDIENKEPIANLPGHGAKTHATFSPDGEWIVSVDENLRGYVWDGRDGSKRYSLAWLRWGLVIDDDSNGSDQAMSDVKFDRSGQHLTYPEDFPEDFESFGKIAVKFISQNYFLTFFINQRYALLYELGDPFAQKVLDLGARPFPSTGSYLRNQSIATAPEAGILVTGQENGNGINVYRFDEESKQLERIWAPRR